jgi:hypothetical protein
MVVGDLPDAIPVRGIANQVGNENGFGLRADHLLDAVHVDLKRVGRDIHEGRGNAGPHHRRHIGREGDRRGDNLIARRQAEHLDRQVESRRARVAHDAPAFGEQLGDSGLHGLDVLADPQGGGPTPQDLDNGFDLPLVMDGAGIVNTATGHRHIRKLPCGWIRVGTAQLSGHRPAGRPGGPTRPVRQSTTTPRPRSCGWCAPRRFAGRRRGRDR